MASGPGTPTFTNDELIDAVRHWVHFDNLAEVLSKQVVNARALQKKYEEKIITILDSNTAQPEPQQCFIFTAKPHTFHQFII